MNLIFDKKLFTQVGLDSGSLTMLGSVVHSFSEPGEYRGTAAKAKGGQAVFYISVDKSSAVLQANIDLASLLEYSEATQKEYSNDKQNHFTVNPKGYVVFHVSGGSGGFSIQVHRVEDDPKKKGFNSKELDAGDIFAASILRPGKYSVANLLQKTKADVIVSYPKIGKTAYRPPDPVRVQVSPSGFEPKNIRLDPGQGLVFDVKARTRIVIELDKPDDGDGVVKKTLPHVWSKHTLPAKKG